MWLSRTKHRNYPQHPPVYTPSGDMVGQRVSSGEGNLVHSRFGIPFLLDLFQTVFCLLGSRNAGWWLFAGKN